MIKNSNNQVLQRLIQNLSHREVATFKERLMAESSRRTSKALQLLMALRENDTITSNQLCTMLKIKSKAQLSTLGRHLLDRLMDMMIVANHEKDIDFRIQYLQSRVNLLLQQGIFREAEKYCNQALQLAGYYEKFQQVSRLLLVKNSIMQNRSFRRYQTGNAIIFEQIQRNSDCQRLLDQIIFLYEQVKILSYRTWLPVDKEEMAGIRRKKAMLDDLKTSPGFVSAYQQPLIKLYYHCALATCLYMLHETSDCAVSCDILLKEWQRVPHLIAAYPALFVATVNTGCYNNFQRDDLRLTKSHLEAYTALAEGYLTSTFFKSTFAIIHFNTALKYHHKQADYDKVAKLLQKESSRILGLNTQLALPDSLSIPTSIYISYFVLEKWDKAENLLLDVKANSREAGREDILFFTWIFHLLILYEKKAWYTLDVMLESTYHFLYSRKCLRLFEKEIIRFIKQLAMARETRGKQRLCADFLTKFRAMTPRKIPLYSRYFNFPAWIESKRLGMRYMDYMTAVNSGKKFVSSVS